MLVPLEPLMEMALDPLVDVPLDPITGVLGATGALLGRVPAGPTRRDGVSRGTTGGLNGSRSGRTISSSGF